MKCLLAVLFALLMAGTCFAAASATRVYEVQPTTGSNLNGGCYDSAFTGVGGSIDYTYITPTVFSFTDLTAVASTTVTSASNPFTAAMVGNCIHLESAAVGTPGFFVITAFTSAGQVTIDTSVTWTTGIGKLGGATASYNGQTTTTLAVSLVPGNIVYHKGSGQTWNEAVVLTVSGSTAVGPITLTGYNATRTDNPTGTARPTNAVASTKVPFTISGSHYIVRHLVASGSSGFGFTSTGSNHLFWNVRATGSASSGLNAGGSYITYWQCESDLNAVSGIANNQVGLMVVGCYSHHNTVSGIRVNTSQTVTILHSIIARNSGNGILFAGGPPVAVLIGNTIDCNGSAANCASAAFDGINLVTGFDFSAGSLIVNNIFSNNERDGVRKTDSLGNNASVIADFNNYFGNVGAARTNFPIGPSDQTLNPTYAAAASGNYAIGTNLQAMGYPGLFPAGTTTGYRDIGAVQHRETFFHVFP